MQRHSERFPKSDRLLRRAEFLRMQRSGRRRAGRNFVVITRERPEGTSRLGITTSRKVGNAPERNRVRRMVREFFRRYRARIEPPQDVLVIARSGAKDLQYRDVVSELERMLHITAE